jgi:hypothetical protein
MFMQIFSAVKKNESLVQSKVLIKNKFNNFNVNILKNIRITQHS